MTAVIRGEIGRWVALVRQHDYHLVALLVAMVSTGRGGMFLASLLHHDPHMLVAYGTAFGLGARGALSIALGIVLAAGVRLGGRLAVYYGALFIGLGWMYDMFLLSLLPFTPWPTVWTFLSLAIAAFLVALKVRAE